MECLIDGSFHWSHFSHALHPLCWERRGAEIEGSGCGVVWSISEDGSGLVHHIAGDVVSDIRCVDADLHLALQEAGQQVHLLPQPHPQGPRSNWWQLRFTQPLSVGPWGPIFHRAGHHLHVRYWHRRLLRLPQYRSVPDSPPSSYPAFFSSFSCLTICPLPDFMLNLVSRVVGSWKSNHVKWFVQIFQKLDWWKF